MPENTYVFLTDSDSDLPYDVADARGIPVIKMPYMLNGEEYYDENGREGEAAQKAFFDKMRAGAVPVTACLSKHNYLEFFEPYLQMGKDMGTRHRAGLGMSENSDAIVIVVSEETGIISMAKNGVLIRRLDRQNLYNMLQEEIIPPEEDEQGAPSLWQRLLQSLRGGQVDA